MKRIFALALIVLIALLMTAFTPLLQEDPGGGLPTVLSIILTTVLIPGLVQVLKFIAANFRVVWTENVVMIICFVVSAIVAAVWIKPILPALPSIDPDPQSFIAAIFGFIGAVIAVGSSVFGLATLIYRLILRPVFNALGLGNKAVKTIAAG